MTEEGQPVADTVPAQSPQRGKSTIEFPYLDLDNAVEIVEAIHKVEGDRCSWNQLAAFLKVQPTGGGFRMRMLTAKMFGLVTYDRGQVSLTDCGIHAADPSHEKRARFDAFMSVPLFKQLFDRFNGQPLPPVAAIERAIETLGVAPKQKERARQVFQRSAKQAGLFELASDRLTVPPGLNSPRKSADDTKKEQETDQKEDRRRASTGGGLPPFIQGLIDKLPPPDAKWDMASRAKWLTTAANIFDLMYTAEDPQNAGLTVTLKGSTLSVDTGGKP